MWWIATSLAATWNIPGDYSSIQDAFDDASVVDGDVLLVGAGAFDGARLDNGKFVTVRGQGITTVLTHPTPGDESVVIDVVASSLVLEDVLIDGEMLAAGVHSEGNSALTLRRVTVQDTRDRATPLPVGGACVSLRDTEAVIEDSILTRCTSDSGGGGAVRVRSGTTLILQDTEISESSTLGRGGAMEIEVGGSATIQDTEYIGNTAGITGGGLEVAGSATLEGGRFADNTAETGGGAVNTASSSAILDATGVVFQNNDATTGNGGALAGPGITTLQAVRIEGNTAAQGAAIASPGPAALTLRNAFLCGNIASTDNHGILGAASGPTREISNVLSYGNGNGSGTVHSIDGTLSNMSFWLDDAATLVRITGGSLTDGVVVGAASDLPVGLTTSNASVTVQSTTVFDATTGGLIGAVDSDDPGLVLGGTDCADVFDAFAVNVVDTGSTATTDTDGSPTDRGHLGGPDADGAFWLADADQDGSLRPSDCDDNDATVSPAAEEVCDGVDNDCDTLTDDADDNLTALTWYLDGDGDGRAPDFAPSAVFCNPPAEYVLYQGDCNDSDPSIYPNSIEACTADMVDNDCDGLVDQADPSWSDVSVAVAEDADGDGFPGSGGAIGACSGEQPPGWVPLAVGADCDDTDGLVNPAAVEVCDQVDNDCDSMVDEDFLSSAYYSDLDQDGFGDGNSTPVLSCEPIPGLVIGTSDCDDTDPDVNPAADEVCDDVDNDCDTFIDEDLFFQDYYPDVDEDGFGDASATPINDCVTPPDTVTDGTDCDDADPDINPDATEVPNDGIDNDCMGGDEQTMLVDSDGDGIPDSIDPNPDGVGDVTGSPPSPAFGCGCATGPSPLSGLWALLGAAALFVRRRQFALD